MKSLNLFAYRLGCSPCRFLALGLAALLFAVPAFAQSSEVERLRNEIEAMRQAYEAQIAAMERRLAQIESNAEEARALAEDNAEGLDEVFSEDFFTVGLPDSITQNFEFKGYLRTGFLFNGDGKNVRNAGEELVHADGRFEIGHRLGNEADNYVELTTIYKHDFGADGPNMNVVSTLAAKYQGDKSNYVDDDQDGTDILFRELYVIADNIVPGNPDVRLWVGQRFYDRHDIHMTDDFYLDMSGWGGGVENIKMGVGNLNVAYIAGSNDSLFIPDEGPGTEHHLDFRYKGIPMLNGDLTLWLNISHLSGSLNMAGEEDNDTGIAVGALHFMTLPATSWLQGGFNKASIMYGWGNASDFNAYVLDWRPTELIEDSKRLLITNQTVWQFSERFSMMTQATIEWDDLGGEEGTTGRSSEDRTYVSVGARPIWMINDYFAMQAEVGFEWVSDIRWTGDVDDEGTLGKITIAPTFRPGGSFFARPELRVFATYGFWNDMPTWYTPGHTAGGEDSVWMFGIQAETWW